MICTQVAMEEWKESHGIWVSNRGKVRNPRTGVEYEPKATMGLYAVVMKSGKRHRVHRLVAEAFLGPRPSQNHTVDHKDRNSKNNRAENLRWATKSEQVINRTLPMNKAGSRPIQVKFGDGPWVDCPSVQSAVREFGFNVGTLSQLLQCKGRVKTVNGAVVRYKALSDAEQYPGERWQLAGNHRVSSYGRVEENHWHHRYMPNPQPETGYCKAFGSFVHRLVMEAFGTPQPGPGCTIDHINRVRHDNRIDNLRWATAAEQNSNQKRKRENVETAHTRPVRATFPDDSVLEFANAVVAGASTGVDPRRISEACNGKAHNKHAKNVHRGSGIRFDFAKATLEDDLDLPSTGREWLIPSDDEEL